MPVYRFGCHDICRSQKNNIGNNSIMGPLNALLDFHKVLFTDSILANWQQLAALRLRLEEVRGVRRMLLRKKKKGKRAFTKDDVKHLHQLEGIIVSLRGQGVLLQSQLMGLAERMRGIEAVWRTEEDEILTWALAGGVEPALDALEGEEEDAEVEVEEAEEEAPPPPMKKDKKTDTAGASTSRGPPPSSPIRDAGGGGREGGVGMGGGVTMHAAVGPGAVLRVGGRIAGICTWFVRAEGGPVERYPEGDPEAAREAEYAAKHARKVAHMRMVAAARVAEERNPHRCFPFPIDKKVKIEKVTPPKRGRKSAGSGGAQVRSVTGVNPITPTYPDYTYLLRSYAPSSAPPRSLRVRRELLTPPPRGRAPVVAHVAEERTLAGQTPPIFVGVDSGEAHGDESSGEDTQIAE